MRLSRWMTLRRITPLFFLLLITGCRGGGTPGGGSTAAGPSGTPETPAAGNRMAPAGPFQVALLTSGPISDAGWHASAYEGLQRVKKELGAEVLHQQTRGPSEFETAFRDFAQRGARLIFAHGNEYGDAAMRVASEFPETTFAVSSGGVKGRNVVSMVFDLGQATYLCGEMAALMSRTGKISCIGGIELPSVKSTFISFEGGAKAARPGVRVTTVYTNSFEDQSAGKEATVALINAGNDFVFHNADQAGLGVIQAIKESKKKNVFGFGSNKNQNALAPDVLLASAVIDIPRAFVELATDVRDKGVQGGTRFMGMKENVISLEFNDRLKNRIPADVMKRIEADRNAIIAGTLKVPRGSL